MDLKQDVGAGHAAVSYRPGPRTFPPSSNGLRFSGERSGAERVRCNRGLAAGCTGRLLDFVYELWVFAEEDDGGWFIS